MKNKLKKIKHNSTLYRWEKQIKNSALSNINIINEATIKYFKKSRTLNKIIHDADLRIWALNYAKENNVTKFKASYNWLSNLKQKEKIVSRKITKFVSNKSFSSSKEEIKLAEDFIKESKLVLENYTNESVFNTDQSGFNLEIHSGRTLNIKGEKSVYGKAQSIGALTHSYTIQPIISADGNLLEPMLLVLQEQNGKFGPRIEKNIFKATNIKIIPSTSGKVTKEILKNWFKEIYFPNVPDRSLLFVDSWSTYKDAKIIKDSTPDKKHVQIRFIPPGTTKYVQPLDVMFFRQWKNFARKITDKIILHEIDINIYQRNNIIKMQSLIHNQFSSPRYKNLIKYAWHKSGYINRPEKFDDPTTFSFNLFDEIISCKFTKCMDVGFMKCSWCCKILCFNHFFVQYHFCNIFEM